MILRLTILSLLFSLVAVSAIGQPSVQRNPYTTNTPGASINVLNGSIEGANDISSTTLEASGVVNMSGSALSQFEGIFSGNGTNLTGLNNAYSVTAPFNISDITVTASGGVLDFSGFNTGVKAVGFIGPASSATNVVGGSVSATSLTISNPDNTQQTPIIGIGGTNSYYQLFLQNANSGTNASTDLVIGNDNATATSTSNYVDLGINSSTYSNSAGLFGGPNDSYLYGATNSTNLILGTQQTNGHVLIYIGAAKTLDVSSNLITAPSGSQFAGNGGGLTNLTYWFSGNSASGGITIAGNTVKDFPLFSTYGGGTGTMSNAYDACPLVAPYTMSGLQFTLTQTVIGSATNLVARVFTNGVYAGFNLTNVGNTNASGFYSTNDYITSIIMAAGGVSNAWTLQISNTSSGTVTYTPSWKSRFTQ